MPHDCPSYPWFDPAGSLIFELTEQRARWGAPGWAQSYDDEAAYDALVTLNDVLTHALSDPTPWTPAPWGPLGPPMPAGGVLPLANSVASGLPLDEANTPPTPVPHAPGPGWILTPPAEPNWAAIDRARILLQRVRDALDI